jgi:hypothetical protein
MWARVTDVVRERSLFMGGGGVGYKGYRISAYLLVSSNEVNVLRYCT